MTSPKVFITDDKEIIRKIIFDGAEEKAIEICKELCKKEYNINDTWSGFGLYLHKACVTDAEKSTKLSEKLENILDTQNEQTYHVGIVLQEVMKFLAGTATKDFKKKVNKNND